MVMNIFENYELNLPKVTGAGFFVSKGVGIHPERIIKDYEIIFVRRGELDIEENNIEYRVGAGEAILLEPGVVHKGTKPYEENLNFYWLHFVLPCMAGKYNLPKKIKLKHPEKLTLIMRDVSSVWQENKLTDLKGGAEVLKIFDELMHVDKENNNHINYPLAVKIDNYLRSNIEKTRKFIAKDLGYNDDYLGRVYFATYKKTITQALQKYRVEKAKILLGETLKNVETISNECSFSDSAYFRRVFKKHTGVSPLEYRHKFSPVFEINI